MNESPVYEVVIGLEIHAQLATKSKLFCGDSISFGASPNSQVSAISLAHPGTLPKTNRQAVALAVQLGLACNCEIEEENYLARKNYFYPDLPKGYQISQHTSPICKGGYLTITTSTGTRNIQLNRIHLEEDAGKSLHDQDPRRSFIDLNRAGTPLVEIVTEPNIYSAEEAAQLVTEIRKLVRWLGVSDGNMEEGSLRCDANISLRPKGTTQLGTKVEVKNLNSIRHLKKAIEHEVSRMTALLLQGQSIQQQTRSFDATTDTTFSLRNKEEANDYRYFPDPDLAPFTITKAYLAQVRANMPELPQQLQERFLQIDGLTPYDAKQLSEEFTTAGFFEATLEICHQPKSIANWILGPIKQWMNEHPTDGISFPISPDELADLIELVETGQVNFSVASGKLLPAIISTHRNARQLAVEMNLLQTNQTDELTNWIEQVLQRMPEKVLEYKKGKKGLIGLFVGEVKKISAGKANPQEVTRLLEEQLNQ
ncbi:MAG: Asp-tRNA(Asn)/Glu-tRNA(Gln) amidotransferase subunit GatB [Bacteroidota bacterium]